MALPPMHALLNSLGDSTQLHDMFEQWMASGEEWHKSQLYIRISNSVGKLENDARGWVTKAELEKKIGEEAAKSMIAFLESTAPEKCRDHPDAPGIQDTSMDLCTTQKSQSVQSKSTVNSSKATWSQTDPNSLISHFQECRQFNVLMKEEMENRKEDWVHKGMECKDESSSDSSSEGAKEKSKGKKAQMGWDLQIILTGTGGFSIRVYAAVSPKLQSPKTFEHPGYLSIMPAMTRKQEIVACLRVIACEKICLSCWLPYITPYLDESLGPRFKIIVIPVSHYHLLGKKGGIRRIS
jgi:hypothetical protein